MASGIYNNIKAELMKKTIDLVNDTVNVALMAVGHGFTATHDTWADVSANEIAAIPAIYVAGGQALIGKAVTVDDVDNEGVWDATDIAWGPAATITAYHAVIYDSTVADDLICSIDFAGAVTCTNGTFTIVWDTEGIVNLT